MRFQLVDEPVGAVVSETNSYFLWGLAPTVGVDVLSVGDPTRRFEMTVNGPTIATPTKLVEWVVITCGEQMGKTLSRPGRRAR